jgi:hypothetical protein
LFLKVLGIIWSQLRDTPMPAVTFWCGWTETLYVVVIEISSRGFDRSSD